MSENRNKQVEPQLQGVFDAMLRQQLRRKRTITDPITGEVYDLDEKISFEPKLR